MRKSIGLLYRYKMIDYSEFIFLLASMLKSASKCANTTGNFRNYLKALGKNARRSFVLVPIHTSMSISSKTRNKVKNTDAISFVKRMNPVDIVYVDPPYNSMHYGAYYSFLNYLCLYDRSVELVGPGIIANYYKSKFGIVKTALREFEELLAQVAQKTRCIILSYSSQGALSIHTLCKLLKTYGSLKLYKFPHKKYQPNKSSTVKKSNFEYVIVVSLSRVVPTVHSISVLGQ
jgi:adenine-specific DNA-methyltransferase